jgi:hypothetical protein
MTTVAEPYKRDDDVQSPTMTLDILSIDPGIQNLGFLFIRAELDNATKKVVSLKNLAGGSAKLDINNTGYPSNSPDTACQIARDVNNFLANKLITTSKYYRRTPEGNDIDAPLYVLVERQYIHPQNWSVGARLLNIQIAIQSACMALGGSYVFTMNPQTINATFGITKKGETKKKNETWKKDALATQFGFEFQTTHEADAMWQVLFQLQALGAVLTDLPKIEIVRK